MTLFFQITIFIEGFKRIKMKNDSCNDFLPKVVQKEWFMPLKEEQREQLQLKLIHRH